MSLDEKGTRPSAMPLNPKSLAATMGLSKADTQLVAMCVGPEGVHTNAATLIFARWIPILNTIISKGAKKVNRAIKRGLDRLVRRATAMVEMLEAWDEVQHVRTADGHVRPVSVARELNNQHAATIASDKAEGRGAHHERSTMWLRILPYPLLAMELVMLSLLFVDFFNASGDVLRMVAAIAVPLAMVAVQFVLITRWAHASNRSREADAQGNFVADQDAASEIRRIWPFATLVAGLAACLVGYRVYSWVRYSLDFTLVELVLLTLLGFAAGAAPSVVKYFAVSRNGSTISREQADLSAQLENNDGKRAKRVQGTQRTLKKASDCSVAIKVGEFAHIGHDVSNASESPWRVLTAAYMWAGEDAPARPEPKTLTVTSLQTGEVVAVPLPFATMPGNAQPNTQPWQLAWMRIVDLDAQVAELTARLARLNEGRDKPMQPELPAAPQ